MLFLAWCHTTLNSRIETNCAACCARTSRLLGPRVVGMMRNDSALSLSTLNVVLWQLLSVELTCIDAWSNTCLVFVFPWRPGGVLLISVQGIAVNVDPVFCTWLLYQPHRGSSRQQQQVSDHFHCFHMPHQCFDSKKFPDHVRLTFFFF